MINSFQTEFDTRSRKNQQEVLFDGESCDLVACLERDGVPLDLAGCTVTGLYQPESMKGKSDSWYEVPTEIQQNRVIVHWDTTYQMQGERKYYIYALVVNVQGEDVAYPCSWILELANSPSFPVDPVQPIPKMLDFSQYTLVNDKWLRVEHVNPTTDEVAQNVHFTGDVVIENLDILDPELKEQIDDIQEKVTDIQETVDGIDGKVALEATSQDIKGRLTNATTGLAAIKAGIDATNLALPSMATGQAVAAVSTALSDQTNGLAAIKGAVNTANSSLQTYVGPNSQLHSWVQSLYGAVVSDDTLATIYNMVGSMTESVADIADAVEDLPEHVTQLLENTQDVPERLADIDGKLDSEEYGLEAIKNAVDSIVPPSGYATSTQAQGIIDRLDNQTNGLAAIRNQAATAATKSTATATALSSNAYGLNAIKTAVDQGVSQATTAAAMSSAAVTIVNDSGYGNQAIKNAVGTVDGRLTDANNGLAAIKLAAASANSNAGAANTILGNSTYGLEAIKGAVNTANSALTNGTYGLQAIKAAVDEISHPTDYARQSTLTAVGASASTAATKSTANYDLLTGNNGLSVIKAGNDLISDKIGSTPYGNLADHLAAVNNSLQDSLDTKATSAQAAQILTLAQETRTLAEVNNTELNAVYGLAGIYGEVQGLQDGTHPLVQAVDAVGTDAATAATQATANNGLLTDSTNGLAAIKTAVNTTNTALSDQTNGLQAIKTQAADAATQAASAATKAQTVATTVNNGTYGNQAIRTAVDAANAALGNSTYGLAKIKQAIDDITFPSDYATSAQATSIINKLDDGTNGLAAIKTQAATAATQATTAATQSTTAATKATANNTLLTDSTNGLAAIKTAVEAAKTVTADQCLQIILSRNLGMSNSPLRITLPQLGSLMYDGFMAGGEMPQMVEVRAIGGAGTLPWPSGSTAPSSFLRGVRGVELLRLTYNTAPTPTALALGISASSITAMPNLRKMYLRTDRETGWTNNTGLTFLQGMQQHPNLVAVKGVGRVVHLSLFNTVSSLPQPAKLEYMDFSEAISTATSQSVGGSSPGVPFSALRVVRLANSSAFAAVFNTPANFPSLEVIDMRTRTVTTIPTITTTSNAIKTGVKVVVPDALATNWAANTNWAHFVTNHGWQIVSASNYTGDDYENYDWEGLDTL